LGLIESEQQLRGVDLHVQRVGVIAELAECFGLGVHQVLAGCGHPE